MNFHWHHRWEVTSASCDGREHYLPSGISGYSGHFLVTEVVQRCATCGKLKQVTLRGRHTRESLSGEDNEVARVLKSMGA